MQREAHLLPHRERPAHVDQRAPVPAVAAADPAGRVVRGHRLDVGAESRRVRAPLSAERGPRRARLPAQRVLPLPRLRARARQSHALSASGVRSAFAFASSALRLIRDAIDALIDDLMDWSVIYAQEQFYTGNEVDDEDTRSAVTALLKHIK